ncbi:EthD domain-containing protein, partial [Nocardioides sp.]|uniref:EthD domain-containing protein n=1 Tax=Nocardioides sp. TaxID=35761 RepID=UPI0027338D7F
GRARVSAVTKRVFALWGTTDLLDPRLRDHLAAAGVRRVQLNVRDAAVDGALALEHLEHPIAALVSTWDGDADQIITALAGVADEVTGWDVDERTPLDPPQVADGERADALANVALIRRPADLAYDAWLEHWHGRHTEVAIATQGTFGYVQNRVLGPATPEAPAVDAIVEELFPSNAVSDVHAFYGSGGDDAELTRRITELMESVAVLGADQRIDLVPTGRYVFTL